MANRHSQRTANITRLCRYVSAGLVSFVLLNVTVAAQSVYKWRDEKGQIHYSQNVPPEVVREEHQRLNNQGVVVEHIEDADVPNMLLESAMTQNQRANRVKKRLLLANYRSEADIEQARDRAFEYIDKETTIVNRQLGSLRQNLSEAETMYRQITDDQGLAYTTLQTTITSLRDSLERQYERARQLHSQRLAVQSQYLEEVQSYREAVALNTQRQLDLPEDASSDG